MAALEGKVAIVTGTSRGVGVGIARALLEAGAIVVGCARRDRCPRIRANCLALGPTMTANFARFVLGRADRGKHYFDDIPIRRAGTPEEVGRTIVFLCSGEVDVINGTTIEMDGGMLPGVRYEPGFAPIRDLLEGAGRA